MMTGIYETVYGIFNHVKNIQSPPKTIRPLAGVAFHKADDFTTDSLLEETMRVFRDLPIKEIFGINYLEFMKLSVDIVDIIIKVAKEHRDKESQVAGKADQTLQKALRDKDRQSQQLENLKTNKGRMR